MERRIPYSLYKRGYNQFPASDYDAKTKTIMVNIPDIKRRVWPKEWKREGNELITPNRCHVYFWNTGLAQNYEVEWHSGPYNRKHRTIPAGFDAFDRVLQTVAEFGGA